MKESKGDNAKERITLAAIHVFAKRGFSDASLREIADEAKMKAPALLHHFENKYSIFSACIERVLKNFEGILNKKLLPIDHAGDKLRKNFEANLEWVEKFPDDTKILIFLFSVATFSEDFRKVYDLLLVAVRKRYFEILCAGEREKLFKLKPTLESAELIHEVSLGLLLNWVSASHRTGERKKILLKWSMFIKSFTGWEIK